MIATALRRLSSPAGAAPPSVRVARNLRPPAAAPAPRRRKVRTIFISDVHLGTRECKAEALAAFLRAHDCETLYLVGDIVDGWRLKRSWFWKPAHDAVIHEILRKAESGRRVVYIPGNHDEVLRPHAGRTLAGVEIVAEALHRTADGRDFLVLHGDCFDGAVRHARWLVPLGDAAYGVAMWLSERIVDLRRLCGLPRWSLAAWLKRAAKNAVAYIDRFERAVAREVAERGLDGAICGHIHHAAIRRVGEALYCNDGDWVDSCTALVEDEDGALSVVDATGRALIVEEARFAAARAA